MSTTKLARSEQGPFAIGAGNLEWYVDTTVELPSSGLTEGDTVYDRQTDTLYIATSATTIEAVGTGSGLGLGATPTTQAFGDVATGGSAITASKNDHLHGMPALGVSPVTQAFGDAPAGGAATTAAKMDHRHGMPANPTAAFATPAIVLGTAAAAGSAGTVIRSNSTIQAFDATAPVTQAFGDASNPGAAAVAARRDHRHGMPTSPAPWTLVSKTVDEIRTLTTTLAVDATLHFAMLANTRYSVRGFIWLTSPATGVFKYDLNGPAAPTLVWSEFSLARTPSTARTFLAPDTDYAGTAGTVNVAAGALLEVNALIANVTAGDFQFRWAQNVSNANQTIVRAGSFLEYRVV